MATYAVLKAQIADDLSRSDLTSQIATAVLAAITYYERKRFYFNEMRSLTFSTVAGTEFYDQDTSAEIAKLLEIDGIKITITSTDIYALEPETNDALEALSQNATIDQGQPTHYAYFNQTLRLYPIPDAAYTVRVWGVKSLTALSADADTNAWTTDAGDLIRARAKWDLLTNVIKDKQQADEMKGVELEALASLDGSTSKRSSSGGTVKATQF